jgi:error-prone DNA polymerase
MPSEARPPVAALCLRLGLRHVKGLREADADAIAAAVRRRGRPFDAIDALWRASGVSVTALRRLANADAFGSMNLDRQHALWHIRALRDEPLPLFDRMSTQQSAIGNQPSDADDHRPDACNHQSQIANPKPQIHLPSISLPRQVVQDYQSIGLSLKAHPVSFLRAELDRRRIIRAADLLDPRKFPTGKYVRVAGIVLVRQRPGTASGVIFMTIEDETGVANLIVRPRIFDRDRRAARHGVIIVAHGKVERDGEVVHLLATRITDATQELTDLLARSRDFH